MTDENPLHSGSRWEPAASPTPMPPQPAVAGTPAASTSRPTPAPTPSGRSRAAGARRGGLAAAVVGLVAAGGLGGLAFGHVAADEGSGQTGQISQQLRTGDDGAGDDQGSGPGTAQPGSPT